MEKEKSMNALRLMYKIRFFEEKAIKIYREKGIAGEFLGALHTYIGEEAIAVGSLINLKKDDYVVSTHRGHGHFIAKGGDPKRILAEIMGRVTGYSRGRGGSMHLFDKEMGFLGGNGVMGAGIPIALGAAYRAKYKNSGQVCVCFFGDGSSTQGTFHESLNIAALWKLPLIYICENNLYAVTTPVSDEVSIPNVGDRASAYGIPGKVIDGQDVLKIEEAVSEAVQRARSGVGPSLIECKTYRFYPHCMVIKETRKEKEINEWKKRDPIISFEKKLLAEGIIDNNYLNEIRQGLEEEMDEAENFAKESPYPDIENFKKEISVF